MARHLLAASSGIAAGVMPVAGFAQDGDVDRAEQRIVAELDAAQANAGPRSADLIEPLTELGALYEAEGRHALASAVLEEARALVRLNYGLYSLEQAPLMQQALANQQALGDFAMVQALEDELLKLADRHPGDLRTVAIHRDAANRRLDILRRFLADEKPGEIYPKVGFYWVDRDEVIRNLVTEAQLHFTGAAAVILRNGLYGSDELRDFEREIVRSGDLLRQRFVRSTFSVHRDSYGVIYNQTLEDRARELSALAGFAYPTGAEYRPSRDGFTTSYELGRDSYRRLIAYDDNALGQTTEEHALRDRVAAHVELADWELLYGKNGPALDQYLRVQELIEPTDVAESLIAEIFAPPIPIVLPAFAPNPLETPESARYIDVSFEITKFGESRRIEIVGAAPEVAEAAKKDLVALIKESRFRPRVEGGELGRASPVVVRYYVNE